MSSVLSKSPCSSHRAAKTFEAIRLIGTRLIFVLGFLVSTETNIFLFSTMEKNNFTVESLLDFSISFCSYNHDSFHRGVEFADEADF